MSTADRADAAHAAGPLLRRLADVGLTRAVLIALAVWSALVISAVVLRHATGSTGTSCLFRSLTGIPCATCGSTRAALSLLSGDPIGAFAHNPLMTLLFATAPAWLGARALRGHRVGRARPARGRRILMWCLVLGALAANWIYVVWRDHQH